MRRVMVGKSRVVWISLLLIGCSRGPQIVPVEGQVLFNGKPLVTGSVMFQPVGGQPARGAIGTDGTFVLSTYSEGDGAVVGPNKVRIVSFAEQKLDAQDGEMPAAPSLLPEKYGSFSTTPLTVEVLAEGNEPFVFDLADEPAPKKIK